MTLSATPSFTPASPAVSRIGRFYITRELGHGPISTVYLAHDPIIDRDVALKTFSTRLTPIERKQHETQFINEARAAGRLTHPHIVTIYEASSEGGTTYIAMEYLQGRPLSKLLESKTVFKLDDVTSIILKIAEAIDYAHRNNVVHRDIKPGNIFLSTDNHPKLVDFGIARSPNRVSDQPLALDQQYTLFRNNLLGTPNYMSPEQALGRPADERTDIYSLGAVMYEMLSGRKPFLSRSADKLLHQIAYKAPQAPHELNHRIPLALSQIVMKAMSKIPDKRYQNASEMVLDIRRYVSHEKRSRRRPIREILATKQDDDKIEGADNKMAHRRLLRISCLALIGGLVTAWSIWCR